MFNKNALHQHVISTIAEPQVKIISAQSVLPSISKNHAQSNGLPKSTGATSIALAQFDTLPDSAYVRLPVVLALFGISKATSYRWVLASRIPAPKKMGNISMYQVGQLRSRLRSLQSSGQFDATGGSK